MVVAALGVSLVAAATAGAKTYIGCHNSKTDRGGGMSLRYKPTRCNTLGPDQSYAEAAHLREMTWSSWGKQAAHGSGYSLGQHKPYSHDHVLIKLYRPTCRGSLPHGGMLFSRMKLTYDDGYVWKIKLAVQC